MAYSSVQFAAATANNGVTSLVAAVAGQRVYVLAYTLDVGGAATAKIQDITTDTARLIVTGVTGNSCAVACAGSREVPLFASAVGEGLEVSSSAAVAVNVTIAYIQAP
jgi:hypothetical protein